MLGCVCVCVCVEVVTWCVRVCLRVGGKMYKHRHEPADGIPNADADAGQHGTWYGGS
jgi:hypothetical protein